MFIEETYDIVTRRVLNEASGELETCTFQQVKKRKHMKGGFNMTYKSYEEAVESLINSKLDFTIWLELKNQFTRSRVENPLSAAVVANKLGCSRSKVSNIIAKAVEMKLLGKVRYGIYRLNPFMIIPYSADGALLQQEWNELMDKADTPPIAQ